MQTRLAETQTEKDAAPRIEHRNFQKRIIADACFPDIERDAEAAACPRRIISLPLYSRSLVDF